MDTDAFIKLRPFAYHLTARVNLSAIERTRCLNPTATIICVVLHPFRDLIAGKRSRVDLGIITIFW